MTVSSADFLVSAIACSNGGAEIDFRNCISRAYYSVYHAALPVADAHFPDTNAALAMGTHERLSKRFLASPTRSAKGVGYVLENLKRARHRADYDLGDEVTGSDAAQAIADARAFAQRLSQCVPATAMSASAVSAQKT
ncbi:MULTISPECIES: hypothetical protein [unclassified Caballeronia]|uniref:hypothetical protein n=1 Tax=unclassified Caballeronia TaxID=2646786 RepID=UPI0028554AC7|nr:MULTISPECIES: hypothetical protein [unclassified Caballeronia]MDR5777374.1 hypothetical protein [Caballeronia sp. LZ002]MDR5802545.1 hypothetical protein [Caballeronia sp. LZ001]MDR5852812.1 hypothetical protein [Caballeronia sp. LZ003]